MSALLAALVLAAGPQEPDVPSLTVGSKNFTESVVLGEIAAALLRERGFDTQHRAELGGTPILWNALRTGDLDAYVEYTGTLLQEILASRELPGPEVLPEVLAAEGLGMSAPLGFNNTYALGMREARAAELGIARVSDLALHADLELGFSSEFLERGDGWPALRAAYRLPHADVRGLDHDLAYRGLMAGELDVVDLYSTDADVQYYELRALVDDRSFFPRYDAVLLYRLDLATRAPGAIEALLAIEGRIDEATMIGLNARAKIDGLSEPRVAAEFLERELGLVVDVVERTWVGRLARNTRDHLLLVTISLLAAVALGVPLGVAAARRPRLGRGLLGLVGIVQTIPSIALFAFLIPLPLVGGLGARPAIAALFLYSLLPIVRGVHAGLRSIPPELVEAARALGLPSRARLFAVELPLAMRSILAGIQTAAVINVGTATIAALIGARGFGQPILTGIRRDDIGTIMEGAVPAALLALGVQLVFELLERGLVPRGLRLAEVGGDGATGGAAGGSSE